MVLIKAIHLAAVVLTIAGFIVRGILLMRNSAWMQTIWVKKLPHLVDTVLLLSGITLAWMTHQNPLEQPWLATKLLALLLYIGAGLVAFRFAQTKRARWSSWLAAIAVFFFMASVAVTKKPLIF